MDGIVSCWNKASTVSLSICDFREFVDFPENEGRGTAKAADQMDAAPELEFRNVSFRYEGAERDTIHNLSLKIRSGEKLALVGLNGAGKTTLVKLLCGLYRPTSGEILYNGIPQFHTLSPPSGSVLYQPLWISNNCLYFPFAAISS